jgi:TonB family protein
MKKLLFFWILVNSQMIFAQDTILYNFINQKVTDWSAVSYYEIHLFDSITNLTNVSTYDSIGVLKNSNQYLNYEKKIKEGKSIQYFQNGEIKVIQHYSNDKKEGELKTFHKNGQLKRIEEYSNGEFVKGTCYDSIGKKIKFFDFEIMPQFPNGQNAYFEYLSKNINYPEEAKALGLKGTVIIEFVIDKDGSIINIRVVQSVHKLVDNEAVRVIQNMPKWIPGKVDGDPVKVTYQIPLRFSLME